MTEALLVEPAPGDLAFEIPPEHEEHEHEEHEHEEHEHEKRDAGSAAGESSPDPRPAARVAAGQLIVEHVPLLRAHAGTPPDMVLTWNAMDSPGSVDVVVHLHGYVVRGRSMQLPTDIVPVSGLDFADPRNRSSAGRTSPTLLVLPRGNFFGGRSGRGYDFPALHRAGALNELIDDAFHRFAGAHPAVGRLILTAHSGGGASLMRILRYADPDEVHTFDALYTDPSPLIAWARRRIARGSGALRVVYRSGEYGTETASLAVELAIRPALTAAGTYPNPRWRVEHTRVAHMDIPPRFGWRLLADVSADLPGVDHRITAPHPAAGAESREALEEYETFGADEALDEFAEWQELVAEADLTEADLTEADLAEADLTEADLAEADLTEADLAEAEVTGPRDMRTAWAEYLCAEREMVTIPLLSNRTPVNPVAVEAFGALAGALTRTGYQAHSTWVYNCRDIAQAAPGQPHRTSLHAYGLAVDIDPAWNPHRHNVSGPVIFSDQPSQAGRQQDVAAGIAGTAFTPSQVAAVEAIRTVDGLRVFGWGGRWRSSHDAMHFEIRLTPAELRRGLGPPPGSAGHPDAAAEHVTCTGCAADEGEFADADAFQDAAGSSRWGLYDQLSLSWGQAEASDD
jgi:hypothetical protein